MPIDMRGHVSGVFKSVPATRHLTTGGWVDGKWVEIVAAPQSFDINTQPATEREIDFLRNGGERITEARRVYINDVGMESITNNGEWEFLGQRWKTVKCDNRFWRNYCKLIVVRIDDQGGQP